jgi:ATP-binding cassette subfamily B protein
VTKKDASGVPRTIAVLEIGDHFGELALLRSAPRNATVRTLTPCLFLTLQREPFLELVAKAPGLLEAIERTVGLRDAAERANRLGDPAPTDR